MKNETHSTLANSNRQMLPGARLKGPANANEIVNLTLKLRRKNPLPQPAATPSKPISRAEFNDTYGINTADVATVKTELAKFNLKVEDPIATDNSITVTGTVADVEKAFQVKLFMYDHESGNYRGRVGNVSIPVALQGIVTAVFGLDTRRVAKRRGPGSKNVKGASAAALPGGATYLPADVATVYNYPAGNGSGQCIGILEFGGGYFASDFQQFCQVANITNLPSVQPVSVNGASTGAQDGAEGEVMLDVEIVANICPAANIVLYFSTFDENGWVTILDKAIGDTTNNPTVLSVSWGAAEDDPNAWTKGAVDNINEALQQASMQGITICVAAGDDGSDDQVGDGMAHTDFPGSSPFVLSVGGTTLTAQNDVRTSEVAWKIGAGIRNQKNDDGSTGGGVSMHFQRPAWQTVTVPSVNPNSIDGRVVPDVAAHANWDLGYFYVVDGNQGANGGTSAAAPMWASLVLLLQAKINKLPFLAPLLYQTLPGGTTAVGASNAFTDITSGDNISAQVGGYTAGPGFDAVSGWGAPNGTQLLSALQQLLNNQPS